MAVANFNRDSLAHWYAQEHLKTDPGILKVVYLPTNADEREIRFIEINELMAERTSEILEPIDFGVDMDSENAHKLWVLDVTPNQWDRIEAGELTLPESWCLENKVELSS